MLAAPSFPLPSPAPFFYLVSDNNLASVQNLTTPRGAYVSLPHLKNMQSAHQNNLTKIKC